MPKLKYLIFTITVTIVLILFNILINDKELNIELIIYCFASSQLSFLIIYFIEKRKKRKKN